MLGNHYFMVRKFYSACSEYEEVLKAHPSNYAVMKRLIICYLKLGNYRKGFKLYYSLILKKPELLFTDTTDQEICPCQEIINDLQASAPAHLNEKEYYLTLAMLWSFRDVKESLNYFRQVQEMGYNIGKIENLIQRLESLIQQVNPPNSNQFQRKE
ncbi:MAG: hypothetical protein Kow0042_08400 [Calditrichia bacterium]